MVSIYMLLYLNNYTPMYFTPDAARQHEQPNAEALEAAQHLKIDISLAVEAEIQTLMKTPEFSGLRLSSPEDILPHLELYTTPQEIAFILSEHELELRPTDTDIKNVLLIFKQPEHMRKPHFTLNNFTSDDLWERLYNKIMPRVWDLVDKFHEKTNLYLQRVNEYGQHDNRINGYYYVWIVTPNEPEISSWDGNIDTDYSEN